jgi:hypothetical protein
MVPRQTPSKQAPASSGRPGRPRPLPSTATVVCTDEPPDTAPDRIPDVCPACGRPWPPFALHLSGFLDLTVVAADALSTATEALGTLKEAIEQEEQP